MVALEAEADVAGTSGASHLQCHPCPSCGAPLGGRAGCQAAFDELSASAWSSPVRAAVHNLIVDSYAMQHPEEYGRSAKSYAAHLCGLCCGIEHAGDRKLYWSIARWLDGRREIAKPPLLRVRGEKTIADVAAIGVDEAFAEAVRAWARSVWNAYFSQHPLAHEWLAAVSRE
jgi:hypothetical protein